MFLEGYSEVLQRQEGGALLALSGGMCGISGAAIAGVLEEHNRADSFKVMAGISTGAPIKTFFRAGQAHYGTSYYTDDCTTDSFRTKWGMDTKWLTGRFRSGPKALDQDAVRASHTLMLAGATNAVTGEGAFHDLKQVDDMLDAVNASMNIPGFTSGPITVGAETYIDGVGAYPFPVQELMAYEPEWLLIIANMPKPHTLDKFIAPMANAMPWSFLTRRYPTAVREQFTSFSGRFYEGLDWLRREKPCPYAILWSHKDAHPLERDADKLRAIAIDERADMEHALRAPLSSAA